MTGWRVCMDYKKLNKATRNDHFSLPPHRSNVRQACWKRISLLFRWLGYNQIAMDQRIKKRQHLLVLMAHLPLEECLLGYAMLQQLFRDA